MVLVWDVASDAAKAEISADPRLTKIVAGMKEKQGDYFLTILDAQSGNEIGKLLIETGKGSFRLSSIFAAGDSVIVTDTQNRVLVYSLKTGQQNLESMEKRDEFTFSSPIAMLRFSQDGQRLFVLTIAQTVYMLDVSSLAQH